MLRIKVTIFLLLLPLLLYTQNIYFDHLGIDDGLSQSSVLSIYQDEIGQIWMGTRDGLNRYNGNEIEILRPVVNDTTGLAVSNIKKVTGSKKGDVFILSSLGLMRYDLHKEQFSKIIASDVSTIHYTDQKLWVGCNNSLNFIADSSLVMHKYNTFDTDIIIQTILQLPDNEIYIGTNKNVLKLDANGKVETIVDAVNATYLYKDSKENVWIGTLKNGLFCHTKSNALKQYVHNEFVTNSISNNFVRCIVEDDNGNYWIGTYGGLNHLDGTTNKISSYHHSARDKHTISDYSIHAMEKDSQGSLWIGTYFGGVNIINPNFSFTKYDETNVLSSGIVSNVVEDHAGNLWICSDNAGLNFFDRKNNKFKHFKHNPSNIRSLTSDALKALCIDEENNTLWIGSNLGGLDKLNLTTHQIIRSGLTTGNPNIDGFVRGLIKYEDKLLVGTHNSVQVYDPKTKTVAHIIPDLDVAQVGQVWDMYMDSSDNLWFSTFSEIYVVDMKTREHWIFSDKIGVTASATFLEDSQHQMWIGTAGQGLYRYNLGTKDFKNYKTHNSNILNNYILDLSETKSGNILLTVNSGLSSFDIKQNTFKNYSNNQFFPFSTFNERSIYITEDEDIVLCSTNGMIIIKEEDLMFKPKPYTVNFCNLSVDNKPIVTTDDSNILSTPIYLADKLSIHESNSVFSVDVFTNNYLRAINPRVQYILEGFDKEWIDAKSKKTITYTNLNAGVYTLKVRSTDDFSDYEAPIRELTITVKPYFYKTWYAFLFYVLAFLGILYIFISRLLLINSLKYTKYKAAHIQEVNESKMRFFINVSHEIRTPVTLIAAQIDYLLNHTDISNAVNNRLLNMRRNANKLKDLINELLDFQKREQGHIMLDMEQIEIIRYLKNILNTFKEYGYKLNIKSTFQTDIESLYMYFDSVQMDKIFYNLLSNSYKFTPQQGEITLLVKKEEHHLIVSIIDTGIGIKQSEVAKIFNRFYQVNDARESTEIPELGTGIGLSLVKEIVDLHHGTIAVSDNEPQGTIFQITLPLDVSVYNNDENIRFLDKSNEPVKPMPISTKAIADILPTATAHGDKKHCIYIVEDNEDLRNILIDIFSPLYKVTAFEDAEQAYETIETDLPSLVVLDVMLPNMTGIELCSKIKTNLNTLHIPVVLLTAAANLEKKIEGLQQGADDYITKPFVVEELLTRCNNLINNRIHISNRGASNETVQNEVYGISDKDREFVEKIEACTLENIKDLNFSIDMLAEKMHVSRTVLFVKLKEILGIAPNKFVLDIKMKKALEILKKEEDMAINEVAFSVGYDSSSYFIKVFKSYYGMTPNEYKKQLK